LEKYAQIASMVFSSPWACTEECLDGVIAILNQASAGQYDDIIKTPAHETYHRSAINPFSDTPIDGSYRLSRVGSVGILPITGAIFPKSNLITNFSGGTSAELLAKDIEIALNTPTISHLVLNIDSPGGAITGIAEVAQLIYESRAKKPIIAYSNGLCASAAYWIASACNEIVHGVTAELGSIGVIASIQSRAAPNGVKNYEFVSSLSPKKRPDLESDEGKGQIQARVDYLGGVFIQAVATYRNVTPETVAQNFGKGDLLVGQQAIAAGMSDGITTLGQLISSLNEKRKGIFMNVEMQEKTGFTPSNRAMPENDTELAVLSERKRVLSILSVKGAMSEDLKEIALAAIKDGKNAGDFALMVLDYQATQEDTVRAKNAARLKLFEAENAAIQQESTSGQGQDDEAERNAIIELMAKAGKGK
jgi:ClpP class serine protease